MTGAWSQARPVNPGNSPSLIIFAYGHPVFNDKQLIQKISLFARNAPMIFRFLWLPAYE
jgi:hypothetical protein